VEASITQVLTVPFLQPSDHCGFSAIGAQKYTHMHNPRTNIKVEINALKYLPIFEVETLAFQLRFQKIHKVPVYIFGPKSGSSDRFSCFPNSLQEVKTFFKVHK
jgi:hypothetical protein